ncbi:MAG TPA: hypothetical protein VMS89_06095 [Methanoregulaceae archaeon]|nr:hypothetical protein [Methanoregulaceae archaeon]
MGDSKKTPVYSILVLACIVLIFTTGCLNQQQVQPPATQVTTSSTIVPPSGIVTPPAMETTAVQVITTVPTDALPADVTQPPPPYAVDIRIDKDRVYSTITVTFVGGPGQIFVKNILVRVTRSDGLKEMKEIPFEGQIPVGASVDLAGTKGSDRVEVYATINGVTYKVRDVNAVYEQY